MLRENCLYFICVFYQIFAKPFMSQETIPLHGLKGDCIYVLTKDLQLHQTVLFGKIFKEPASSSLPEVLRDGGLVIKLV